MSPLRLFNGISMAKIQRRSPRFPARPNKECLQRIPKQHRAKEPVLRTNRASQRRPGDLPHSCDTRHRLATDSPQTRHRLSTSSPYLRSLPEQKHWYATNIDGTDLNCEIIFAKTALALQDPM
jgi:hypothetical protein